MQHNFCVVKGRYDVYNKVFTYVVFMIIIIYTIFVNTACNAVHELFEFITALGKNKTLIYLHLHLFSWIFSPFHRLQWVAYLEFNSSSSSTGKEESETLTWDNLGVISRTDKMRSMTRQGIPHSLRAQLWLRLSGKIKSTTHIMILVKLKDFIFLNNGK